MRLIDVGTFRKHFFKLNEEFRPAQIDAIFDCVGNSELVDAVPVIRCKDCARNPHNNGGKRILCPCPMDRYMGDEGYCSKAELRGEE